MSRVFSRNNEKETKAEPAKVTTQPLQLAQDKTRVVMPVPKGPPAIRLGPNDAPMQPGALKAGGKLPLGSSKPMLTSAPCAPSVVTGNTPALIYTQGAAGQDRDFIASDYPHGMLATLPAVQRNLVLLAMSQPDHVLAATFAGELGALGGVAGIRAVTHFLSGAGGVLTYNHGTPFSVLASQSFAFKFALAVARMNIQIKLRAQASTCHIDYTKIKLSSGAIPDIHFRLTQGADKALFSVIGGTQALWVSITNFTADLTKRTYSAVLRFDIYDDFGVDETDLYSPALISFYVLQHFRDGHKPFIHRLIIESRITGSY